MNSRFEERIGFCILSINILEYGVIKITQYRKHRRHKHVGVCVCMGVIKLHDVRPKTVLEKHVHDIANI